MSAAPFDVNRKTFEELVLRAPLPVLLSFHGAWSKPCEVVSKALGDVAEKYAGKALVARVDVDRELDLTRQFHVKTVPTVILFTGGEAAEKLVGLRSLKEFESLVERYI